MESVVFDGELAEPEGDCVGGVGVGRVNFEVVEGGSLGRPEIGIGHLDYKACGGGIVGGCGRDVFHPYSIGRGG